MKNHPYRIMCVATTVLAFCACAEQWDDLKPTEAQQEEEVIFFSATVLSGQDATRTRADQTIVNKNEYALSPTGTGGPRVGVFGYYTGTQTWNETVAGTDYTGYTAGQLWGQYNPNVIGENVLLDEKGPTPDLFYNLPLTIAPPSGSSNMLHYASNDAKRFWPNNGNGTDKVSFWAYYPYNPTHLSGENGIDFDNTPEYIGEGTGRGHLRFRMNRDASQNVDLLVSDLVKDCQKANYPLLTDDGTTFYPKRVELLFRHLLAQVRVYANIFGQDEVTYLTEEQVINGETVTVNKKVTAGDEYEGKKALDEFGNEFTLAVGDNIPDDYLVQNTTGGWNALTTPQKEQVKTVRWKRSETLKNIKGNYRPADFGMRLAFHNIRIQGTYTLTPHFDNSIRGTIYPFAVSGGLDSVYVSNYVQNPYWFKYEDWDTGKKHPKLNEEYMYGHFEETSEYSTNPDTHSYTLTDANLDPHATGSHDNHHFNFSEHNIFLVVPQKLNDDEVPNITIVFTGKNRYTDANLWSRVTVNMLNMNIKWESGFIYSYAIVEDLRPGDDKVLGPESIVVGFDPSKITDQW